MTTMTKEQMRQVVQQWVQAGPELERIRMEALRDKPYNEEEVNALLELGDFWHESRTSSGLQQMQERLALAYGRRSTHRSPTSSSTRRR